MSTQQLTYNISGQGKLKKFMYPYTNKVYNFLSYYNYDYKFHSTKQLGALQYLLKGAHHTRYEYIFFQWTLINEFKDKGTGLGLNSNNINNKDLYLDSIERKPSPAELLQCLAILTNMGHFADTFSASKLWLYLIRNNVNGFRTGLKKG